MVGWLTVAACAAEPSANHCKNHPLQKGGKASPALTMMPDDDDDDGKDDDDDDGDDDG